MGKKSEGEICKKRTSVLAEAELPRTADFTAQEAVVTLQEYQAAVARTEAAEAEKAALAARSSRPGRLWGKAIEVFIKYPRFRLFPGGDSILSVIVST